MSPPRFVVSTGRCGSTLIGDVLGTHPSVLNISEVFSALQPDAFPPGLVSRDDFWGMLSTPRPIWTLALAHQIEPIEFRYPVDGGEMTFNRTTGVPPIAAVCLPTISRTPDQLFGELATAIPETPHMPVGGHYSRLFDWLAERTGRAAWIERSGGSLLYAADVVTHFHRPKVLHLYRTGWRTALSMSRHTFFRLAVVRNALRGFVGFDPFAAGAPAVPAGAVPPPFDEVLPDRFDPRAFWQLPLAVEQFGRQWSVMMLQGVRHLSRLPAATVWHLSYEELLDSPVDVIAGLVAFFELPDPPEGWLASAADMIGTTRASDPKLEPAERDLLMRACAPGERYLAQATARSHR